MDIMVNSILTSFLENHPKIDNGKHTHTILGRGSYTIKEDELNEFYALLKDAIFTNNESIPILEKIQSQCPLVIDFDFKYKKKLTNRQYDEDVIKKFITHIFSKINELYILSDEKKVCFVMEKESFVDAPQRGYESKDGLHFLFPYIIAEKDTFKVLRKALLDLDMEAICKDSGFTPPSNNIESIIDEAIYKGGNWFVYGAGKPTEHCKYKLTRIFKETNSALMPLPTKIWTDNPLEVIKLNSVSHRSELTVDYTDKLQKGLKKKKLKPSISTESIDSIELNPYVLGKAMKYDMDIAKKLTECLSVERATDNKSWIDVGYCLHSIHSETMLPSWISFSKKWAMYTSDDECKQQWRYMNTNNTPQYTIATLHYWAKQDNYDMWKQVMKDSLESLVITSIKGDKSTGPHSDVANVIYHYFKDCFRCGNIRDNTWYFFNEALGGKWEITEQGHILRARLSSEIVDLYMTYLKKYQDIANQEDEESEKKSIYETRVGNICKVIVKLKDSSYKDKIMKECKEYFYDKKFMEKLNDKKDLIGFENGVYDLTKSQFREGLPDDYVSLSTGLALPVINQDKPIGIDDLVELSKELLNYEERYEGLYDFLDKVFPIESVLEYTLRFLSSCLSGEVREEKFYFWTGSGGNGKSKLVELIDLAFGEYSRTMDVAFLTTKRGSSSSASPELESIKHARFVTMSEPEKSDQIFVGKLKQMTGGDKMTSRGLFKETTQFKPQFKVVLMCNELPTLAGNDGGTWRRIEVVKYISKFTDNPRPSPADPHQYVADEQLSVKLEEWKMLFMITLLKKFQVYSKKGTNPPKEVKDETKMYKTSNDIISQWSTDALEESDELTSFQEIYDAYENWCDDEGYSSKQRPDKAEVKKELMKMQGKTTYGLVLGKRHVDGCPNGTKTKPKFNFTVIDE